jgi:regulator of cell morphogenesis and NO signaling
MGTPTTVGDLARENLARIAVFEDFGIDYCCGGGRTLDDACQRSGCDPEAVVAALAACDAADRDETATDWNAASLNELLDHIVERHHQYLRGDLPHLGELMAKVQAAHGENHPEADEVAAVLARLTREIGSHLDKEEQVLFPFIRRLEKAGAAALPAGAAIGDPIGVMEREHDEAGEALASLRRLTNGYIPPADACLTFEALLAGLAELERDLHEHIHKENNILHPRALALAAGTAGVEEA